MTNDCLPPSAQEWLTPLQANFLARFFASGAGSSFFLTGGTALAAFHLHHRLSVDLDLFTLDDLAMREAKVLIPELAAGLQCQLGRARQTAHLGQYLLEPETGDPLQIDLVRDFGPQYGQHIQVSDVISPTHPP